MVSILIVLLIPSFTNAQYGAFSKGERVKWTAQNPYNRFPDGRPIVPDEILERMKSEPGVYIATPIFDEGIDVPAIDVVVLAGAGKSHIKLLQRIGRGLRKKEGEDNTLVIHDFIDDTNKYLFKHSKARVAVYKDEKFDKELIR